MPVTITPQDISVVVQGPYHPKRTPECLASVSQYLPGAEVILSTWEDDPDVSAARDVAADRVLLNHDPGPINLAELLPLDIQRHILAENFNRHVVSTRNGLAEARRPFALKLRTDFRVNHGGFLNDFQRFQGIGGPLRVFEERIVTTHAHSPHRSYCLHVQDFCWFGRTADLRLLWDVPLIPPRDALLSLGTAEREARLLIPEQQLITTALRRITSDGMTNALSVNADLIDLTERFLAGNFICVEMERFGASALKPELAIFNDDAAARFTGLWMARASFVEFLSWGGKHGLDLVAASGIASDSYEAGLREAAIKGQLMGPMQRIDVHALFTAADVLHRTGRIADARQAYGTLVRLGIKDDRITRAIALLDERPASGEL